MNDFFAGAALNFLWLGVPEVEGGAKEFEGFAEAGGGLDFNEFV